MYNAQLKIGDIIFGLSSDESAGRFNLEEPHRKFVCAGSPEVTVRGYYSGIPHIPLNGQDIVFESGTFWNVYREDRHFIFVLQVPSSVSPYCIAAFQDNFKVGDVYYSSEFISKAPDGSLPYPLAFPLFHLLAMSFLSRGYGILIHACGIDDGGRGYLFPGSSTHGKTTVARLWKDDAIILNDERVILRQHNGSLWIYGTPWHGECDEVSPHGVPLEKVFFLRKAGINGAVRLEGVVAASNLFSHCFLPYWEVEGMNFILEFCAGVAKDLPCYSLDFVPEKSIVEFVRCVK